MLSAPVPVRADEPPGGNIGKDLPGFKLPLTPAGEAALQHNLTTAPAVGSSATRIVTMVRQGQVGQLLASLPPARRGVVAEAIRSAFAAGLNDLLIVTAALAFTGAVCALVLIRSRDFVRTGRSPEPPGASAAAAGTGADGTSRARSA